MILIFCFTLASAVLAAPSQTDDMMFTLDGVGESAAHTQPPPVVRLGSTASQLRRCTLSFSILRVISFEFELLYYISKMLLRYILIKILYEFIYIKLQHYANLKKVPDKKYL